MIDKIDNINKAKENLSEADKSESIATQKFKCVFPECDFETDDYKELEEHMKTHIHEKNDETKESKKENTAFTEKIRLVKGKEGYLCPFCNRVFDKKHGLKLHLSLSHNKKFKDVFFREGDEDGESTVSEEGV